MRYLNSLRHITRIVLGTIAILWFLGFIVPKIPVVQQTMGQKVSEALAEKLGTKVKIGQIDVRLPGRVIIDDIVIYDQANKEMIRAGRLAAGIDIMPLLDGKIRISSVQIFATRIALYQKDGHSPLNCQFMLDSLKSKDTTSSAPLNLAIASVIIRHSSLRYDRQDIPKTRHRFSASHIGVSELSSNIVLRALTDDSLNVQVKHLSLKEQSGLMVNDISGAAQVAHDKARITDFHIQLPNSVINIEALAFPLAKVQGTGTLILDGHITPADLAFLEPKLSVFDKPLHLRARADGSTKTMKAAVTARLSDNSFKLNAQATCHDVTGNIHGTLNLAEAVVSQRFFDRLQPLGISIPQQVRNLGDIASGGTVTMQDKKSFRGNMKIAMSNAGKADLTADYHDKSLTAHLKTPGIALNNITGENKLGDLACNIDIKTSDITNLKKNTTARGTITAIHYNDYTYQDITLDGSLSGNVVSGTLNINDPNITLHVNGSVNLAAKDISHVTVELRNFSPKHLNLTDIFGDDPLSAQASITPHNVTLTSNIVDIDMQGNIDIATVPYSITNIIASQLPSMPGIPRCITTHNDFTITTTVKDGGVLSRLLKTDVTIPEEIALNGYIHDDEHLADLQLKIPNMTISGNRFEATNLHLSTPDKAFQTTITTTAYLGGRPVDFSLNMRGKDDMLSTSFSWDNLRAHIFRGTIFANTQLGKTYNGEPDITTVIPYSTFQVSDSIWTVQAQRIEYADGAVGIDNFHVGNATQKIYLNGTLSKNAGDSLVADLSKVNVKYILDLVNFNSVEFDGKASGHFVGHNILADIRAGGYLDVEDFMFENGTFGDMHIDAAYSKETERIDINAEATDTVADGKLYIAGNIKPSSPGGLDLDIRPENARLEFMRTYSQSFMKDVKLQGTGRVRLYGPFSNINLTGQLVAKGSCTLSSTNCQYTLPGDTVTFIPDDIQLNGITLKDKFGNTALLHGGIHHKHLTQMSYDLDATTARLLAYDFPTPSGDDTFCGYALINGDIGVHGQGNELNITADATPLEESFITYNASSPATVRNDDIIQWRSAHTSLLAHNDSPDTAHSTQELDKGNDRTNIHLNFQLHTTPNAKVHLIMDETAGDYIDIFGSGDLRVEYFNKGGLNIFGNYEVDHGTYKMTLQSIIRRDFSFRKGGTVTFGGDPYNAIIDAHAVYALNSVPLADLNIGSNFVSNNVPVNCLMNITGTPAKPKIAFSVELPTMSADARQMVNSVINSEEEMNQQVIYLLAIGRFYASSKLASTSSSTSATEVSQSTLAVQSFLSGTLSQSFTNMMSGMMSGLMRRGNNISFGANIAPGTDGFNNAEYEGILSGNFFSGRLTFNGQFGYRDRVTTNTSSFIGDFSLQYLLTKNGIISLKVYNQTNDRYFTKNALNTQGIGVVFQEEWGK